MSNTPHPVPAQPAESDWAFVEELRCTPYHQPVRWPAPTRRPRRGEAGAARGLSLTPGFPDPAGRLETAYADFRVFLGSAGVPDSGPYGLVTRYNDACAREEYRVSVTPDQCELAASDAEGIRRGLVWIEDEMLRRGGPFLPLGTVNRWPLVRTRISRCFYGPVNRPPKCKDELADDVDYYPEEYLNRLAHQGVNVLWLTIHFFNTVPSKIIPEYGRNAGPRLEKLRRTVRKCERYGIRIYPFCIEPAAFTWPHPEVAAAAAAHPELKGHHGAFCTSTDQGRAYVREAITTLFTDVPGLGGLIVIPVGERFTHCYSDGIPDGGTYPTPNTCPRCSKRQPWDVLREVLATMAGAMHNVAPEAELVAWPYGQFIAWGREKTIEAAAHMPDQIILQHNFETGGHNRQLGKLRPTWDYWLSYAGPSDLFRQSAIAATTNGVRMSAKLQVGCSHEVATTQVVPAPGILYRKYRQMHRLGVSAAMHSWYFGTYPSLMARAAGELSFAPKSGSEREFLLSLAQRDWGRDAPAVVQAWDWFRQGYSQYPTAHVFGYFGPMHDGPVWPLHLIPRRLPLAPTWQIGYPPSGDYIAECVTNGFTLAEMLVLCRRMSDRWARGVRIMKRLRHRYQADPERLRDIGICAALGIQFRSGFNILRFYDLRERLADATEPRTRLRLLDQMRAIVRDELRGDRELLTLAEADSRLGFHSEAEGYKYFPALIRWRQAELRRLLREDFPAVTRRCRQPAPLFPEYTGETPVGGVHRATRLAVVPTGDDALAAQPWAGLATADCEHWLHQMHNHERWRKCGYDWADHTPVADAEKHGRQTSWLAAYDAEAITVRVCCTAGVSIAGVEPSFAGNGVQVFLEPCRTQPRIVFQLSPGGACRCLRDDGYIPRRDDPWQAWSRVDGGVWTTVLRIPFAWLRDQSDGDPLRPLRINVVRSLPIHGKPGTGLCSWAKQEPAKGRLVWGFLNPATDFGWLRFDR